MKKLFKWLIIICAIKTMLLVGIAFAGRVNSTIEFMRNVSAGSWTAPTNLVVGYTSSANGTYTNGLERTNYYRLYGTNDLGRTPPSMVVTSIWTGATNASNVAVIGWNRADGFNQFIIELSTNADFDGNTNWIATTSGGATTNYSDYGTNIIGTNVFTNVLSQASDPTVPWTVAGAVTNWSSYPALGNVNMGGFSITNVTNIVGAGTGGIGIDGSGNITVSGSLLTDGGTGARIAMGLGNITAYSVQPWVLLDDTTGGDANWSWEADADEMWFESSEDGIVFRFDSDANAWFSNAVYVGGILYATNVSGQLYMDGTQEQNFTASYLVITNMLSTNLTSVSATDSNLTATIAGQYFCYFSVSFQGGVTEEYELAVHVNDTEQDNIEAQRKTANNDIGNMSGAGILILSANDVVDLRGKSLDAAADFDPNKVQLVLMKLN